MLAPSIRGASPSPNYEDTMTNKEWLDWFDAQTRTQKRNIMDAVDALEAVGFRSSLAHEFVQIAARMGSSLTGITENARAWKRGVN